MHFPCDDDQLKLTVRRVLCEAEYWEKLRAELSIWEEPGKRVALVFLTRVPRPLWWNQQNNE
jgi:hypothetical protein